LLLLIEWYCSHLYNSPPFLLLLLPPTPPPPPSSQQQKLLPLLLQGDKGQASYNRLYVMVVNIIKSALLMVGALSPPSSSIYPTAVAAVLAGGGLATLTITWFYACTPRYYSDVSSSK